MPNVFQSIWKNRKVKAVQKKMHELEKKKDQLSRELNKAKDQALREHKKKHAKRTHHKRHYY